jgi:hypothetical protein
MIGEKNIEKIFFALDRQILAVGGSCISLVVCGGTALAALGLVSRTTKDVDVLGSLEKGRVRKIGRFPEWLSVAAAKVAEDFDLPADWLNLGPESQLDTGLPKGLAGRLQMKNYGQRLTVCFISRIDQVHFKLYASLDRGGYHVQDLFKLAPTKSELLEACRWVLTQDVSPGFKTLLISFLEQHGHEDLAGTV